MKYNSSTPEQIFNTKDGRTIYKTHDGFKCWLLAGSGADPLQVEAKYFTQVKNSKGTVAVDKLIFC